MNIPTVILLERLWRELGPLQVPWHVRNADGKQNMLCLESLGSVRFYLGRGYWEDSEEEVRDTEIDRYIDREKERGRDRERRDKERERWRGERQKNSGGRGG